MNFIGCWWRRKLELADGYDNIPVMYGIKYKIKSYNREWQSKYAFNLWKEELTALEEYINDDNKMWMILGFTTVSNPEPHFETQKTGIFVECPFYQTEYVIGTKPSRMLANVIAPQIQSPTRTMMEMMATNDKKYDVEFMKEWMEQDPDEDN